MIDFNGKSISLYRSLIRAISYFPDRFARAIIYKQILHRFRKAQTREIGGSKKKANLVGKGFKSIWQTKESIARLKQRLSQGQQKLGVLTRAACGDADCFLKVLMIAYGRVGRRRRELIKVLIAEDPGNVPNDTAALLAIIEGGDNLEKLLENKNPKGGPKFNSFLQSQHTCLTKDVRNTIKDLEPKIPKENIWGRSLPLKRVATIKKDWWSMVLNNMLPPVPKDEFERLEGLSTGRLPVEWLLSRRIPAVSLNAQDEVKDSFHWINILRCPIRDLDEAEIDRIKCTSYGLARDKDKMNTLPKYARAPISKLIRSQRSMRRLYGKVWSLTPTMSKDKISGQWITEWGKGSSKYLAGQVTQFRTSDAVFFQGLEGLSEGKKDT